MSPSHGLDSVARIAAAYVILYLVSDALAVTRMVDGLAFAPWNASPALSLALLARLGPRWLPAAVAAPLLAGLMHGTEVGAWPWLLARAVVEACSASLGAAILSGIKRDGEFAHLRTVARFFAAAAVVSVGITLERIGEGLPATLSNIAGLSFAGRIFVANLAALACLAPILTFYDFAPLRMLRWPVPAYETVMQILALAAVAWEVFGRFANSEMHFFYLLFLPVAWITTRHGQRGAALALAFVYLTAVASDWMLVHDLRSAFELQARLGVLAVTALLLGTMVSERRLSQERALAQQNELAHLQRLNIGWEMASALAHELNQPLSAAMNYNHAALRLLSASVPDVARALEALAKGVNQIEAAGQTIHGLRNFMRKGELRLERTSVDDTIERAFRLVSAEANGANVVLRTSGLSGLPPVLADPVQIAQVLVNLIRNAQQAMAEARMEGGVVTVSGAVAGEMVAVSVSDSGPGIAADVADRIFMPFVTTKASGMGLGLAISKSILESHGGDLRAEPLPQGVSFTLTLPRAFAPEAEEDA